MYMYMNLHVLGQANMIYRLASASLLYSLQLGRHHFLLVWLPEMAEIRLNYFLINIPKMGVASSIIYRH